MSQEKKVMLAVLASLLFHLLVFLGFAWWRSVYPIVPVVSKAQPPPEITLIPMEPPPLAAAPTPPPEKTFIRSDDMAEADQPPDSNFESDRDTLAASEKSGSGPKNLPSVQGRESDNIELQNRILSLGGSAQGATGPKTPRQPPVKPIPDLAKLDQPTPQPSPPPVETPQPLTEDSIALGRPSPTPTPQVRQPPASGGTYQPMTHATRLEGSLSNRGRPSIAARGTPTGRYLRQVEAAIGSRWYYYIRRDRAYISPGSVRIIFCINKNGKVEDLRRLANTANESFASCSEQSIFDAELPPIPDDVAKTLYTGRLELPFTFTYQD